VSRCNHQGHVVCPYLPNYVIWQPLVRQSSLSPAAINKANFAILVGKICCRCFDHRAIVRIPVILISHSGRSRSPIPVILITLFTVPEEGTADSMTWRWTATTDG
jgi:hypothetical protein